MNIKHIFLYIAISLSGLLNAQVFIEDLKVEGLENPLGIDVQHPRLGWIVSSKEDSTIQVAYRILVASSAEKLGRDQADLWDSGKILSDESQAVNYKGKALENKEEAFWKVKIWTSSEESSWSDSGYWSMGIMNYADWKSTRWIGLDQASSGDSLTQFSRLSSRYLRKEIDIKKKISGAKVYIMGLGLYELYINGNRIGNQVLAPVPTDYTKNVKYNVMDVTAQLQQGLNAIGAILGNGRYFTMRQHYKPYKIKNFGFPKMAMQLDIIYEDGSHEVIKTDPSWKITTEGPIISNNEYDGEIYDSRKEMPGWNKVGFDDSAWREATYVQEPGGFYEAQMTPNMVIKEQLRPEAIIRKNSDKFILDMGQNMAGWLQMKVKGPKGTKVSLRFAETLDAANNLYTDNLRDARVTDTYILSGKGKEIWEPSFVYHGFRYVEISGYPGEPELDHFTGKVIYDDLETTGTFECSNDIMNQVFKNAYWGIRSNYKGMPVDCPQRNERQPWLGDRTTGAYGESFLFDNSTLYAKWLDDIEYAQTKDGGIPDVAPAFWRYYGDNVTWPGAYITVADMLYRQFGDLRSIKQHYPSMKKWITYMDETYKKDHLMTKDKYGDWCVPPESLELIHTQDPTRKTDGVLIASAYYIHLLDLMKKFARLIQADKKDLNYYDELSKEISSAFNQRFLNEEGNYDNGTVTANLLALAFDIVPPSKKEQLFDHIVKDIVFTYDGHISTGVIGTQYLMRTLTRFGRADLAFQLASNDTYPSWGYMAKNGATTIWELWNGNTADPSMNSQNHVMLLGDLMIWYYEDIAGIKSDPNSPAFKHILMKPAFVDGLDFVNASFKSKYGLIKSNWRKTDSTITWDIQIPGNTTASVFIPPDSKEIKVNNKEFNALNQTGKMLPLKLGSGSHTVTFRSLGIVQDTIKTGIR